VNLTRTNWPSGWLPNNDAVNGDPNGLLRMDNLRIDKTGVLGLIDGQQKVGGTGFGYYASFFSKVILGIEYIWTSTGTPPNSIRRSAFSPMAGETDMAISGGGTPTNFCAFGDAYGYTLICAGNLRVKDPVSSTPKPLGLFTPTNQITKEGPVGTINSAINLIIPCPTFTATGTGVSPYMVLDSTWFTGALCTETPFGVDTTYIGSGPTFDPGSDIISFPFTCWDKPTTIIKRVVLDFILDGDPTDQATYNNYYELNFDYDQLQVGISTQTPLTAKRSNAVRFGTDQSKNWTNVIGVRFLVVATEDANVQFGDITIIGGSEGGLNGVYNYLQLDVCDDGHYEAKSPTGALGVETNSGTRNTDFTVIDGSVTLQPVVNNPNATAHFFFRKSSSNLGIDPNTGMSLNTSTLNLFNYVGQSALGVAFKDTLSDTEILQMNADGTLLPNLYLETLNSQDIPNPLWEDILAIEGIYNERMLYMTSGLVYLSDRLNPDAVDTRYTLKPSGDPSEKNLWLKKLTNNVLILATTKDLYEITGTMLDLPDGTIDVNMRSIGEAYPPLSRDVCHLDNGLYYIAADGLRVTAGSNSINVSPQLRPLFQNVILTGAVHTTAVHGVPTVAIYDGSEVNYSIAAVRGRIYFSVPCQDGTRRLYAFDTVTKTYYPLFTDPFKIYSTQGGELFASYGDGTSWFLDSIPGYGLDGPGGGQGLQFKLRTVFDTNQQPRNRKDTFTLKLVLDTGGRDVSVDIQKDGKGVSETDETSWINLGHFSANGQQTIYIPLSTAAVTLGFRYALQLSDVNGVYTFKLYEATIEYEPRPEQLDYLRILPTNLGAISRKRWTTFAFVIDTLGNPISFIPYLDNVAWGRVATINNGTKLTFIFYFESEAIAIDIGGILSGGVFEYYGLNLEECVSEKLPSPATFLVIPPNNYGTPNRKRHTSYKFQILTRGANVQFTPILDGASYTPATYNTIIKQTVDYFFTQSDGDVIGVDIGGTLKSLTSTPFEFYGTVQPQTVELLPDRLEYLRIPNSNFGLAARKRIRTISLILDTKGGSVTFTPYVDNVAYSISTIFTTTGKSTVYFYFTSDVTGIDFGGVLQTNSGIPFEYYALGTPENVESLPLPTEYYIIPPNDYGTPNRKRHTSYKFQIDTRGMPVQFTPLLDGVSYPPTTYTTGRKQTVEYFFPLGDIIGIDIGGILQSANPYPQFNVPFEFYGVVVPQKVETLPDRLEYLKIPNSNFGLAARKRIRTISLVLDTLGGNAIFTPYADGVICGPATTFVTNGKLTVYYYFTSDVLGVDFGGTLTGSVPFEFYALGTPDNVEQLPLPVEYFVIPPNDYGTPNRKRHTSYKFQIITRGADVIFTPIVDGVPYSPTTYNTRFKQTVDYFFPPGDVIGVDIGGTLKSTGNVPFEFYGTVVPQTVETLPDRLEYLRIPNSNFGIADRKRIRTISLILDTRGGTVRFTPFIDNTPYSIAQNFVTNGKQTVWFYFTSDVTGVDFGGTLESLDGVPFEFYSLGTPDNVEKLPLPTKFFIIPPNDYGKPNRKRHTSYKFQIDTRGKPVVFTPLLDGVSYPPTTYITNVKKTIEYFFPLGDVIGIDVSGTLSGEFPFEFYEVVVPQTVETLPDRLEYLRIPNSNFGVASPKRIRTLPLVIDTRNIDVTFTPIVDGVQLAPSVFNTTAKTTVLHYFKTDVFGIDFGGILQCNSPAFEFYEMGTPEDVEVLPVAKKYDQLGPQRFDKIGKFFGFRVRLIATGTTTSIPYSIFGDNSGTDPTYSNPLFSGAFPVVPGQDGVYEIQFPKNVNTDIFRLTLGPTSDPFYRYNILVRVQTSGMQGQSKWVPIR
jgi:hypothetical protein